MKIKHTLLNKIDSLLTSNPWTNVYGVARSLLAFGTLITLLANHSSILFNTVGSGSINHDWQSTVGLFNILKDQLELARFLAMGVLLLVISGWRPRITGILHAYVSYSFFISCPIIDGGDHITSLLSFLLLPICLTDSRKWHWSSPKNISTLSATSQIAVLFAWGTFLLIRLQACFVYFQAGEAKMQVNDWTNGTAVYYWATNHYHGVADWIKPLTISLLSNTYIVMGLTWGVIVFELLLASAIVMPPTSRKRKLLLVAGMIFHLGIVSVHGLVSFFFAMSALLVLYLRPANVQINLSAFTKLSPIDLIKNILPTKSQPVDSRELT
jgi:antimicrobial peptide system SdpB family protein